MLSAQTPLYFGWSSVAPEAADYDGDGRFEIGLYDSRKGSVSVRKLNGDRLAFDMQVALTGFAAAPADFDGDRKADLCTYERSTGLWYVWLSSEEYVTLGYVQTASGNSLVEPVPADYDGDGKADPALYESSSGIWIIYFSSLNYQPVSGIFGGSDMLAVPADYDGDGKTDPAVYDAGNGHFWTLFSSTQYGLVGAALGGPGCVAASADFDGDGKADPTVYYSALGIWGTLHSTSNYALNIIQQGGPNCLPVPGHYYYTNRADYAVYNVTNGCWYIAYNSLGGFWSGLFGSFFKALVKGAGTETGKGIAGWSLKKIFGHGEDPGDPHWEEAKQMLSEMNQKLDELLSGQQAITNMLMHLSDRLEYDKNEIEWFVSQSAANNAISIIESHYDQHGIDGYASFYQCDTNNPPSCSDVDTFVNIVLGSTYNVKTAVNNIYRAVIPATGSSSNGVLRLWANMAKNTLTPDNLLDQYAALAYYFATMYNYQMKGAAMYVDASRVHGTSEWAKAATATWITNDLMNMVQEEVDEFRAVTYDYVMTAINAGYNPLSMGNVLAITNVPDVLSFLEFYARKWRAEDEHACATFLTVDRPGKLGWYAGVIGARGGGGLRAPQSVITNYVTGRPYGCRDAVTSTVICVSDRYAFLRYDFGQLPPADSPYDVERQAGSSIDIIGQISVSNYDENMSVTTNVAVTNWFGHLYASPVNIEQTRVSLEDSCWQNHTYDSVSYNHALPGQFNAYYGYGTSAAKSLTNNYLMSCSMWYDLLCHSGKIPSVMGIDPWIHAIGTPFTISNHIGRALGVYAFVSVDNSQVEAKRYDVDCVSPPRAYPNQTWDCRDCGGVAFFTTNTGMGAWGALPAGSYTYVSGRKYYNVDTVSTSAVNCVAMTYGTVSSSVADAVLYIGGRFNINQHCYDHFGWAVNPYKACIEGKIQFKIKDIIITFY